MQSQEHYNYWFMKTHLQIKNCQTQQLYFERVMSLKWLQWVTRFLELYYYSFRGWMFDRLCLNWLWGHGTADYCNFSLRLTDEWLTIFDVNLGQWKTKKGQMPAMQSASFALWKLHLIMQMLPQSSAVQSVNGPRTRDFFNDSSRTFSFFFQ